MKLSIIIPVYKVEKYIVECIESVVVQLKPEHEVEIICINDGTPDQSFCILKEYISKIEKNLASKFIFIEQENLGLSGARNTGINNAKGLYISFIDSDDRIYPNYIEKILNIIKNNDFDILDFNIQTSNNIVLQTQLDGVFVDKLEAVFKAGNWFAWARVFSKKMFINLRFTTDIYYEDIDLLPLIYLKATNLIHIKDVLYWYRSNPEGITQNLSEKSKKYTLDSLEKIYNKYNLINTRENAYLNFMVFHTYYVLTIYSTRLYNVSNALSYIKKYRKSASFEANKNLKGLLSQEAKFFLKYPYSFVFLYSCYCYLKKIKVKINFYS